jgi:hypothetical protein
MPVWTFKHPTMRDAFATIVAEEHELMDIYLAGAPATSLVKEIICGKVELEGAKIVVPKDRYTKVVERLSELQGSRQKLQLLYDFLEERCDREFLCGYLAAKPDFIQRITIQSWLIYNPGARLLARLHELKLIPERLRAKYIQRILSR